MARNVNIRPAMLVAQVVAGLAALTSFLYFLLLRDSSAFAGRWAIFSGVLTMTTGLLNLAMLLSTDRLREAPTLRNAVIVSMPCPLILAGLTLAGVGLGSDVFLILGSSLAVGVFLLGVGLFVRYLYGTARRD